MPRLPAGGPGHPRSGRRPLAVLAAAALLAGCGAFPEIPAARDRPVAGRDATAAGGGPAARPRRSPAWPAGATVRVVMNDRFRYRPGAIMVRAGRKVTFVVSNVGRLPHEFVLGDRATQLAHERQMQDGTGGHSHDEGGHAHGASVGGISVPPGQTRRLSRTFEEPGIVMYGCHVLGHWAAGMKGTVVVVAASGPPPLPATSPLHP
jgi:uncharacterized cupredoxin-like copper-binding protein